MGYDFEELLLTKGGYYPKAHGDLENELFLIRVGLIQLLTGNAHIKMDVMSFPATASEEDLAFQKKLREFLEKCVDEGIALPVRIVPGPPTPQPNMADLRTYQDPKS